MDKIKRRLIILVCMLVLFVGCIPNLNTNTTVGATTGSVIGASLGAIIGSQTGSTAEGIVIGAIAGGGSGALVGSVLDKQEIKIENQENLINEQSAYINDKNSNMAHLKNTSNLIGFNKDKTNYSRLKYSRENYPTDNNNSAVNLDRAYQGNPYSKPIVISNNSVDSQVQENYPNEVITNNPNPNWGRDNNVYNQPIISKEIITYGTTNNQNPQIQREQIIYQQQNPKAEFNTEPVIVYTQPQTEVTRASLEWDSIDNTNQPNKWDLNDYNYDEAKPRVDHTINTENLNAREGGKIILREQVLQEQRIPETRVQPNQNVEIIESFPIEEPKKINLNSDECLEAEKEVSSAKKSENNSERLFHYRRALRLCPENSNYHVYLGNVYKNMDRKKDAIFEYSEALKLNPSNPDAIEQLNLYKYENENTY